MYLWDLSIQDREFPYIMDKKKETPYLDLHIGSSGKGFSYVALHDFFLLPRSFSRSARRIFPYSDSFLLYEGFAFCFLHPSHM